jgi:hypothetical protein
MINHDVVTSLRVKPGSRLQLDDRDPAWTGPGKTAHHGKAKARAEANADLEALPERARWGDYMRAYEATLSATSTDWAPWYVIPTDLEEARRQLEAEGS